MVVSKWGMHLDVKRGLMRDIILPIVTQYQPEQATEVTDRLLAEPLDQLFPLFSYDLDDLVQYQYTKRSTTILVDRLRYTLEAVKASQSRHNIAQRTRPPAAKPMFEYATVSDSILCYEGSSRENRIKDKTWLGIDGIVDVCPGRRWTANSWTVEKAADIIFVHCAGNDFIDRDEDRQARGDSGFYRNDNRTGKDQARKFTYPKVKKELSEEFKRVFNSKLSRLAGFAKKQLRFCFLGEWITWKPGYYYPCDTHKVEDVDNAHHPASRHDRFIKQLMDIASTIPRVIARHIKHHEIAHLPVTPDGWHFTKEAGRELRDIIRGLGCGVRYMMTRPPPVPAPVPPATATSSHLTNFHGGASAGWRVKITTTQYEHFVGILTEFNTQTGRWDVVIESLPGQERWAGEHKYLLPEEYKLWPPGSVEKTPIPTLVEKSSAANTPAGKDGTNATPSLHHQPHLPQRDRNHRHTTSPRNQSRARPRYMWTHQQSSYTLAPCSITTISLEGLTP